MSRPIEDYALISDSRTAGLVARDGSMDWLCLPRFDSGACFAALLGDERHGRWLIGPASPARETQRRYRDGTLVLETEHATDGGRVRVVDCMRRGERWPAVVRLVEGLSGTVPMRMELVLRFDYGSVVPWVRRIPGALHAIAGPDAVELRTPVKIHGAGLTSVASFEVTRGQTIPFALSWHPSHEAPPAAFDPVETMRATTGWWRGWSKACAYQGPWRSAVVTSLAVLKALTYAPTGGIVAAATTSLPEEIGGVRNWDYRYCWLRDATFTLYALMKSGYTEEAKAWRDWLIRAVAGTPESIQIMYGLGGERRLPELELDWLPGYANTRPVRIGNAAVNQHQLDVYGEVMDSMHLARSLGLDPDPVAWRVQKHLLDFLESGWREPDEGLWEVRGPRQHFTHSKVMAWVAFDRGVKAIERFGADGPVERWRAIRDAIHGEVCTRGFDASRDAFTQAYGSKVLDASLLMIPLVRFLPASDPRVAGTVRAIEEDLLRDGFVERYPTSANADGLPGGEATFLLCSFWLADNYALLGRRKDAVRMFERLLAIRNDVGLLSEEYCPTQRRLLGNFPQAFSHMGLINTALNLRAEVPRPTRGDDAG